MASYPSVNTDSILYERSDIYSDKNIKITLLDGSTLEVWGEFFINGNPVGEVGALLIASQPEAEAGVNNTAAMTPLRTKQAIDAQAVTDTIWVGDDAPVDTDMELWYDTNAIALDPTPMIGDTVDTNEPYRVILFSDGTCRAIPLDTEAPSIPTGLSYNARINSVKLTWTAASGASSYAIYRDGVQIGTTPNLSYRDNTVTVSATYDYSIQALNIYGLRSGITSTVTAFIDPALNIAPVVEVRSWPTTVAEGNRAVIRVNASDADAQFLAITLGVDIGSLISSSDPSIWILEA